MIELTGIPILRIGDYKKSIDFYIDFLGFVIDWEHRYGPNEPVYMQISRNGLILQLSENPRFHTSTFVYVTTHGIDELYKELLNRKTDYSVPQIEITPWHTKQLEA